MFETFRAEMREKQRLKWEKKRKIGKQSFMIHHGILKWGGTMFVLTNIGVLARHQELNWHYVVSLLIACPLAGYVWARCMWSLHEDRFYGAKKRQDSIKES